MNYRIENTDAPPISHTLVHCEESFDCGEALVAREIAISPIITEHRNKSGRKKEGGKRSERESVNVERKEKSGTDIESLAGNAIISQYPRGRNHPGRGVY